MQTRYTGCCQQRVLDLLQTAVYRRCWNTARPRMEARALITTTFLGAYETRLPDRVFILVHRVPSSNRGIFLFLDPDARHRYRQTAELSRGNDLI